MAAMTAAIKLTARPEQIARLTQLCDRVRWKPTELLRTAADAGEVAFVDSFDELTPNEAEHLIVWVYGLVEFAIERFRPRKSPEVRL